MQSIDSIETYAYGTSNKQEQESIGLKHFNDSKDFIEYSNDMDDIF